MQQTRLNQLLARFSQQHILVLGDFFLDKYLIIDRTLSEPSLETGLEAHQVVEVRVRPGAGGTVVNNLRALGVNVTVLSVIGADGAGFELRRALTAQGTDTAALLTAAGRFTPTYTKPLMREADGSMHELNRLDIQNRAPLSAELQEQVIAQLHALAPHVDAIVVSDQVVEPECGVVTARVRQALATLGKAGALIAVDSRARIGNFRHVILKPNAREALAAVGTPPADENAISAVRAIAAGRTLFDRTGESVFLTLGSQGVFVIAHSGETHVPGIPVGGPIDIVGAGDSMMAGLAAALSSGASPAEAAWVGNLAAAVTVQQLGDTGTASPEQVRALFNAL